MVFLEITAHCDYDFVRYKSTLNYLLTYLLTYYGSAKFHPESVNSVCPASFAAIRQCLRFLVILLPSAVANDGQVCVPYLKCQTSFQRGPKIYKTWRFSVVWITQGH